MRIANIPLPREHGAWAVLLVPMVIVSSIKQAASLELVLLALSTVALFVATVPLETILRNMFLARQESQKVRTAKMWATFYSALSVFLATPLLLQGFWWLMGFGILALFVFVATFFLVRSSQKTIVSDLIATIGLSITGLSSYYLIEGTLDVVGLQIWGFNVLFFGSTVFYVHMKIRATRFKENGFGIKERLSIGKLNLAYHVATVAVVTVLASLHYTTELALVAFLPMLIHSIYGTVKLSNTVRFKNLGFILVGQSVLFAAALTMVMSVS